MPALRAHRQTQDRARADARLCKPPMLDAVSSALVPAKQGALWSGGWVLLGPQHGHLLRSDSSAVAAGSRRRMTVTGDGDDRTVSRALLDGRTVRHVHVFRRSKSVAAIAIDSAA
jgi:hypothetical protein